MDTFALGLFEEAVEAFQVIGMTAAGEGWITVSGLRLRKIGCHAVLLQGVDEGLQHVLRLASECKARVLFRF